MPSLPLQAIYSSFTPSPHQLLHEASRAMAFWPHRRAIDMQAKAYFLRFYIIEQLIGAMIAP